MKSKIIDLMGRLSFPKDSITDISNALDAIYRDKDLANRFEGLIKIYDESERCDYMKLYEDMNSISKECGIHEYTGLMLLLLGMCDGLKRRYGERGLSEYMFYNTVADLKYKNEECRLLYGVSGTFVYPWFPGFYMLERFALGRLQFELSKLGCDCECNGIALTKDSDVISMHIPRTGTRLDHKDVLDSYRQAKEFYKDHFNGGPLVFVCHSWLLYPWNETVLSPSSNLYAFYKDFQIVAQGDNPNHEDAWRLFDCILPDDPSKLPRDSSLRRAYADRIASGEPTGWGYGVFIMNQNE